MNDIPKYNLAPLDCSVYQIFERRNLLTGALDNYTHPYEVVIAFPDSMGERGVMASVFYDELPTNEKLYTDAKNEMRKWMKPDNFLTAGTYTPSAYDELRIKAIRKTLRLSPKIPPPLPSTVLHNVGA